MGKLKIFETPILVIKPFEANNRILMSATFDVSGDYDPEAEWME